MYHYRIWPEIWTQNVEACWHESAIQVRIQGKNRSVFRTSQIMRLCIQIDVIWRHSCSDVLLPIDMYTENPYRLSRGLYKYISRSWHHSFSDLSHCLQNFTGWAVIEELSIRRRFHTFLVSYGQKTRVKHCYVDLSSWFEFWFAMICIDMNVILDLSTAMQQFYRRFRLPVHGSTQTSLKNVFIEIQRPVPTIGNISSTDVPLLR